MAIGDNQHFPSPRIAVSASDAKPAPSPYAALNGARRDAAADALPADADAEAARLGAETERLAALKRALWDSFQVAPQSPVRAPIVDLTMAYTDALRLELKLRASAKEQRSAAAKVLAKSGIRSM